MSLSGHILIILILTSCGFGKVSLPVFPKGPLAVKSKVQARSLSRLEEKLLSLHIYQMLRLRETRRSPASETKKVSVLNLEIQKIQDSLLKDMEEGQHSRSQLVSAINKFAKGSSPRLFSVLALLRNLKERTEEAPLTNAIFQQELQNLEKLQEFRVFESNIEHLTYVGAVDSRTPVIDRI